MNQRDADEAKWLRFQASLAVLGSAKIDEATVARIAKRVIAESDGPLFKIADPEIAKCEGVRKYIDAVSDSVRSECQRGGMQ